MSIEQNQDDEFKSQVGAYVRAFERMEEDGCPHAFSYEENRKMAVDLASGNAISEISAKSLSLTEGRAARKFGLGAVSRANILDGQRVASTEDTRQVAFGGENIQSEPA